MSQTKETKPQLSAVRYKFLVNLAINGLVPFIVYILLRPLVASDVDALAIAGAIPALRAIALWLWRRRVDWIGVHAALGFAIALAFSIFLSGNALLFKIHGTLLTGVIGLVLLVSVVLGKPLLLPFFQVFRQSSPEGTSLFDKAAIGPTNRRRISGRISFVTTVIGLALFANMVVHVILALTLPTVTYLGISHVTTLAILGGGLALLWWTRQRNTSLPSF